MKKHIVFIGAGAVGGYVGSHLARVGENVSLVDPWPQHVDTINRDGMKLSGSQGEHVVRVRAMHVHEVQSFVRKPVDIAINLHQIVRHRMGGADDQAVSVATGLYRVNAKWH